MAKLIFYDDTHTYTVDGEEVPSVSEISRFVSREIYGEVRQYNLDEACERGSAVHKATEVLDKYKKVECPEDIGNYVLAYVQFKRDFHIGDYVAIEKPIAHTELQYAGTIDRIYKIDKCFAEKVKEQCKIDITDKIGQNAIIDLKTSCTVQKVLAQIQLNAYRLDAEYNGLGEIGALFILHLQKDQKYKLIPFPLDETLFMSCLNLHNALKHKKRKKGD